MAPGWMLTQHTTPGALILTLRLLAWGVLLRISWQVSAEWFIGLAGCVNFIFAGVGWSEMARKLRTI